MGENMKKVVIINGYNGVGKDTFVDYVGKYRKVMNYSSISAIKDIAILAGWKGSKEEKDRKFLSDLKLLCSSYSDLPMKAMEEKYKYFLTTNAEYLFLHIREPQEIELAQKKFDAITVLITNERVPQIKSNYADANVYNYIYDYYIDNSETFENLEEAAKLFIDSIEDNS